jgi:1,4-alpha-glucan branching enzyme
VKSAAALLVTVASVAHAGQVVASLSARRGPKFLDRAVIYQIWMRSFTPEGTLAASAKRLRHIAELAATIAYLGPINLMSRQGGYTNPYRIKDYYAIDPKHGTEEDLRAFTTEAHRLGLKAMMDIDCYHTALDSVMMATLLATFASCNGCSATGNRPRPSKRSGRRSAAGSRAARDF